MRKASSQSSSTTMEISRDDILYILNGKLDYIIAHLDSKRDEKTNPPPPVIEEGGSGKITKKSSYIAGALGYLGVDQTGETPDKLLEFLNAEFKFDFDPCPKNPQFDGLSVSWGTINYVNPPYNDIAQWVTKALTERDTHGSTSVFLVPFRPHTKYFRDLILPNASEVRFFRHKFAFKGYTKASLAVAVVIFRPSAPVALEEQHDRRFNVLNITEHGGERSSGHVLDLVNSIFHFDQISSEPDIENIDVECSNLILTNAHPEAFIDKAGAVFEKYRKTIGLIIPLRIESSYFIQKIMFGTPTHVLAITPTFSMPGFQRPTPTGSVVLIWTDEPVVQLYREYGFKMSIVEENFHRTCKD